jgi:hypothetical protein
MWPEAYSVSFASTVAMAQFSMTMREAAMAGPQFFPLVERTRGSSGVTTGSAVLLLRRCPRSPPGT